jgi:GTP pyrophosphokinase
MIGGQNIQDYKSWYENNITSYRSLARKADSLIKKLLAAEKILYYDIQSREKKIDSFLEKLRTKAYNEPREMTDLAGVRIAYVPGDVKKICGVIEDNFEIDSNKSEDTSQRLGVDRVGYKSIHYIAAFPRERIESPEYSILKGLNFEIQVRTILQHSWAEIEHDRNYKFSGELPEKIERGLMLVAGTLELCDNEFERIIKEVDEYTARISAETKKGQLNVPIDSPSIRAYLTEKFGDIEDFKATFGLLIDKIIIEELRLYGINKLEELDEIIQNNFKDKYGKLPRPKNGLTLFRILTQIMVMHDPQRYFKTVWPNRKGMFDQHDYLVFKEFGLDLSKFPEETEFDCSGL